MRRRHPLAVVILALVVATLLAFGPVRVWDALTLRTVEERSETDGTSIHFEVRLWDDQSVANAVGVVTYRDENGHKIKTTRRLRDGRTEVRYWEGDELRGLSHSDLNWVRSSGANGLNPTVGFGDTDGTYWIKWGGTEQVLVRSRVIVERRTSPPWFTDEEILQAVEGVEE